jgi:hypothetical protein
VYSPHHSEYLFVEPKPTSFVIIFDENPEKPESESSVDGWSKKERKNPGQSRAVDQIL